MLVSFHFNSVTITAVRRMGTELLAMKTERKALYLPSVHAHCTQGERLRTEHVFRKGHVSYFRNGQEVQCQG